MESIISYNDLPRSQGESIYLRMETDPKLYLSLLSKGYRMVNNIVNAQADTIYVTGRRQDFECKTSEEYKDLVDSNIQSGLAESNIVKPMEAKFSIEDLLNYKYQIPFVLKNENQNGGREKFLINTEEDYENLICACKFLLNKDDELLFDVDDADIKCKINYYQYLTRNFVVQEYIETPSEYNTTVRLLTSPSNDLLYASLKYNKPEEYVDYTTLLGYLLSKIYPLSTKSIVSNTLSGGENLLLGESDYNSFEKRLLKEHDIKSSKFDELIDTSLKVHEQNREELGIICGFDYIYDQEKGNWFLLEYHSRPMVGDYSKRQGINYDTKEDRITAEGRVRATALSLTLKK